MPTLEQLLAEKERRAQPTRETELLAEAQRRGLSVPGIVPAVTDQLQQRQDTELPAPDEKGILDYLMGIGEPAAALMGAAVGDVAGGLGGLAKTITSGPEAGAETLKGIQEYFAYGDPRTEAGRAGTQAVGEALLPIVEPVGKAVQAVGDVAYEAGGPIAGAAAVTALAAIPEILGLKGSRAAKKMATRQILQKSDPTELFVGGKLKPEITQSLQASGIPESEFLELLPERLPEQAARQQRFTEAGVPITKGELTQEFGQQATEQRLLQTEGDVASEPLRQFKLKQSEVIKKHLDDSFGADVTASETGELIQDALKGRKKLLRTQKNDLYQQAAEKTKEIGSVPVLGDSIVGAIPDERTMRRLDRTSKGAITDLNETLAEFGVVEATEAMVKKGIEPELLTLENFDDLRQALNQIERGDQSGAASVAIGPIRKALDVEIDELANTVGEKGLPADVIEPLKQARKTVTQLKTEFDPKGLINRLITKKGQGADMIVEASKVYDKLSARSTAVEQVNRTMNSLNKAGDKGQEAIASLQTSILMDLIDAGFSTESRTVSGVKTFNPIAFKKRIKNIGQDKLDSIFKNNRESFRAIRNIEKISSDLVPAAGAVPKGSASVILDLMNNLGIAGISTKMPGGAIVIGALQKLGQPIKVGADVRKALRAEPDVVQLQSLVDAHYPGLAGALGISETLKTGD